MYKSLFDKIVVDKNLKAKVAERIDNNMKSRRKLILKTGAIAACLALVLSMGAMAAWRYLSAGRVAEELGDKKLAHNFYDSIAFSQVEEDGIYRCAILGIHSGENISDFTGSQWEVQPERTYVAVMMERIDGEPMTYEDRLMVSPFIQGLEPWRFNVFTLGGSAGSVIEDGVLYSIVECDSIECFADRQLYLAVYEGIAPGSEMYNMDDDTGIITANPEYDGANMLLELTLDENRADPAKAEEYVRRISEEMGWD